MQYMHIANTQEPSSTPLDFMHQVMQFKPNRSNDFNFS